MKHDPEVNIYFAESHFDLATIYLSDLKEKPMNKEQLEALQKVLDYLSDEKGDYEAQGCPENHIYADVQKLEQFLGQPSI